MGKRTPEKESVPSQLKVARYVADQKIEERLSLGRTLQGKSAGIGSPDAYEAYSNECDSWNEYNSSLLKTLFTGTEISEEYEGIVGRSFSMRPTFAERISYVRRELDEQMRRMDSIRSRLGLFEEPAAVAVLLPAKMAGPKESSRSVFIVHVHDGASKEAVARFLSQLDLNPIILHEQPNGGKTVIEKFEANADVSFAVVIMTPDDEANAVSAPETKERRARQNVVLELGYFIGRLSRKHVAALKETSVQVPSDISGVVYIDLDAGGAWKLSLAKEIKNAGINVDMNKAI